MTNKKEQKHIGCKPRHTHTAIERSTYIRRLGNNIIQVQIPYARSISTLNSPQLWYRNAVSNIGNRWPSRIQAHWQQFVPTMWYIAIYTRETHCCIAMYVSRLQCKHGLIPLQMHRQCDLDGTKMQQVGCMICFLSTSPEDIFMLTNNTIDCLRACWCYFYAQAHRTQFFYIENMKLAINVRQWMRLQPHSCECVWALLVTLYSPYDMLALFFVFLF